MDTLTEMLRRLLRAEVEITDERQHPNTSELNVLLRDINNLKWDIKVIGNALARLLYSIGQSPECSEPGTHGLGWRCSTQADIESQWLAYWCNKLKIAPLYHRKVWEFCYVLQVLHEHGALEPGRKGIGFGCGEEPLPSLLASMAIGVTVTDLPPAEAAARGWVETGQHAGALESCHKDYLCDKSDFFSRVELRFLDMNAIPEELHGGYDFCWSICALEHLGSIEAGRKFVARSMDVLKPGGVSVHTTEFNFAFDEKTIDDWPTVLFRRKDLLVLKERLIAAGYEVPDADFSVGDKVLDRFIDVPPYPHQREYLGMGLEQAPHLKLSVDGFPATCVGFYAVKPGV